MAGLIHRHWLEFASFTLLCLIAGVWGAAPGAGAAGDEVPVITLSVDIQPGDSIQAGDYPAYRSTLFPPIVLDTSAGPSGPWPASAEATIARECWSEPGFVCEEYHPYTVTESMRFTGTFDPATATLTGELEHRAETFMPEVSACDGDGLGQLEALHVRTETGTLSVSWSEAESRFVGTMAGTEEATAEHWDYAPALDGPLCQGRHLITDLQQSRPILWKITSPELPSPTSQTAPVDTTAASTTGDTNAQLLPTGAAEEPDDTETEDPFALPESEQSGGFPWPAFIAAIAVLLAILAALGGLRGWQHRTGTDDSHDDDREGKALLLELTYPAGPSPKVFTTGWLFGARAIANPGTPEEVDISESVQWSGTGSFNPAIGNRSRPVFATEGGNVITLTAAYGEQTATRTFDVVAVSPAGYAHVGSRAECLADTHGCPACPHRVRGRVTQGSPSVLVGGIPAARQGDIGVHQAGARNADEHEAMISDLQHAIWHDRAEPTPTDDLRLVCCGPNTFTIVGGDPTVLIDGRPAARTGDPTQHCGGTGTLIG